MATQPTSQAGPPTLNLWEAALQDLDPEERDIVTKHTQDTNPTDVLQIVEKKGQEAWNNRISFKRKSGEVVFLHDIFTKVAQWAKKFVEVGDAAVQYDPAHAALPWAAVRFILQASISDIQRQAAVLESVTDVARVVPLGAIMECLYLTYPSTAAESLKAALRKLYALCWSSLAKALRYHGQTKMKRVAKSVLDLDSDLSPLSKSIADQWALVERSATLARDEGLLSHISKSKSYNEKLVQMMNDIQTPISRIEMYGEKVYQTLDEMKRDQILDSISTIPYRQHQTKVHRNVLPGTGKWLLDHQVVRNWFSSSGSEILWLHGIPGSGKSSLVSVLVGKLIAESTQNPSSHPIYFYCNRNPAEKERADPTHILRSLLKQLSMPLSPNALPSCVVNKFNEERDLQSLDLGATLDLMKAIIETRTITYIVLDALDECDAALRDDLTAALENILQESQSLVKIFVSSRNDADLVCWLRRYPNKEILSSDNQPDLAAFVDDEVDKRVNGRPRRLLRARKISDTLRDEIKRTLKTQAQGMFRWAELQLQYICKLVTENDIRRRLGALPQSLTDIYHDIYQRNMSELRHDNPEYEADAKKVFHLMLTSDNPWDPIDMANMLEPAENSVDRGPEKVFRVTFHLITHDKELNVLRFAHLSVREYFETHLSEFTPSRSREASVEASLDYLKKTRDFGFRPLSYPSKRWFIDVANLSTKEISAQFADRLTQFLVYDVRTFKSWLREIMEQDRNSFEDYDLPSPSTLDCFEDYDLPFPRTLDSFEDYDRPSPRTLDSSDGTSLFTACALGLYDIVSHLIDTKPSSVHARNLEGEPPLLVACTWTRSTDIVSLLLQNGAAINERAGHDQNSTALGAALSVSYPSIAVIRKLLENGADPNCMHGWKQTCPLHIAVSGFQYEAVELLLKYGADPNLASGTRRETALQVAVSGEYSCPLETIRKLLEASGGIKVSNYTLRLAVACQREDVVATLLSFGAEVNAPDAKTDRTSSYNDLDINRSVLFLAIARGKKQIVQQLLFHGATPGPQDYIEDYTFERLLRSGDTELARLLLFAPNQDLRATTMIKAARHLEEDEIMTQLGILEKERPDEREMHKAMEFAAERGLMKVFKRLVDHSYNCSLLHSYKCLALAGTARRGQVEMFKILWASLLRNRPTSEAEDELPSAELDNSHAFIVSLNAPSEYESRTPLSTLLYDAAMGGSTEIFRLILVEGAMSTMDRGKWSDEIPETIISSATISIIDTDKHEAITNEIRDHGAWYLHAAVTAGQAEMVDLLLRLGADSNAIAPGLHRQNALCTALIKRKDRDTIKLLLMSGADVNARLSTFSFGRDRCGTALTMALFRGEKHVIYGTGELAETPATVIELLLQHHADANAADDKEGSILQLAVSQRHIGATKLLLTYGADVNKGGGAAGTPLIAAVASKFDIDERMEMAEILLKNGADVNKSGGDCGYGSPLIAAVLFQKHSTNTGLIELLLKSGADVNAEHPGPHQTAFRAALSTRGPISQQIFQILLNHGADLSATGRDGTQALYVACASGVCDESRVEYLLSQGADVNASGGEYGNALQAACAASCPSTMVELLIANDANVNAKGGRFGNALQAASYAGCLRTVEILLAKGADVNANGGKYGHALQAAAMSSKPMSKMKLLLLYGANVNAVGGKYGTALQATCAKRFLDQSESVPINLLLSRGADPNIRGGKYGYPLICAIAKAYTHEVWPVNLLLDGGADINCSHEKHGNALYAACKRSSEALMKMLIERGISATQLAGEHEHALFLACLENDYRGRAKLAQVLLDNGVDVNIHGKRYSCALEVAIKAGNLAAAKLLIERGADVHVETANDGSLLDIAIRLSRSATNDVGEEDESDVEEEDDIFLGRDHSSAIVKLLRANGA